MNTRHTAKQARRHSKAAQVAKTQVTEHNMPSKGKQAKAHNNHDTTEQAARHAKKATMWQVSAPRVNRKTSRTVDKSVIKPTPTADKSLEAQTAV